MCKDKSFLLKYGWTASRLETRWTTNMSVDALSCVRIFRARTAPPTFTTHSSFCCRSCRSATSRPEEPQLEPNWNQNRNRIRLLQTDLLTPCVRFFPWLFTQKQNKKVQCAAGLRTHHFWIRSIRKKNTNLDASINFFLALVPGVIRGSNTVGLVYRRNAGKSELNMKWTSA